MPENIDIQSLPNVLTIVDMEPNQSGIIVEIHGGQKIASRLSTLGLVVGANIKKISRHILQGPVVIETGRTQIAIGFNMAQKVLVFCN
ncbi:ferrous iron transport protein A [Candidatus Desantisbacteria bacterium]|nr:ferrous iron transport protein A [Candidatus Desantisbacteria bacterium]